MLEFLKVILLGIVEGITEWLPISSTGHMILVEQFVKLNVTEEFLEMFRVVIQLGAILNIDNQALYPILLLAFVFFTFSITDLLKGNGYLAVYIAGIMVGNNKIMHRKDIYTFMDGLTWLFQIIMFLCLGLLVNPHEMLEVAAVALLIGVFQILALIPGTSRSGSTILGAILLGCSRSVAAEFSFFLSIPVMFGASLLKLLKFGLHFTGYEAAILLVGMVTAFVVSILAIKFLMGYIKKNNFKPFGYYRIALGVLVLAYFIFLG